MKRAENKQKNKGKIPCIKLKKKINFTKGQNFRSFESKIEEKNLSLQETKKKIQIDEKCACYKTLEKKSTFVFFQHEY